MDALKAFTSKLENWKRMVNIKRWYNIWKIVIRSCCWWWRPCASTIYQNENLYHLTVLENEISRYFSELSDGELDLVRNPFKLSVRKALDDCQDEYLELETDSGAIGTFDEKSITEFWPLMCDSYPKVGERAIHAFLVFVSTYLCESSFSTLLQTKTK